MAGAISRLFARGRALPWARVYFLAEWAYRKGRAARDGLTQTERGELGRLLRKSKGRRSNLTTREFDRLRTLTMKSFHAARRA